MSTCISRVALSLLSTMKLSYQRIHVNNRRRSGGPGERPVVTHDLVNVLQCICDSRAPASWSDI